MTARRSTTLLATVAIVAGSLALSPGTAGGQTPTCEEPYSPVAFAESYPAQEALPAVPGDDVARPLVYDIPIDSDGDGTADTVTDGQGDTATLGRGDGDVVLTAAGATSVDLYGVGDIDGDGRDDLAAGVYEGADEGTFLVPGTVAAGTIAVVDAGIRLADGFAGLVLPPDSSGRLIVTEPGPTASTGVRDAGEVLALGPGADATATAADLVVEGELVVFADLGEPAVAFVVAVGSTDPDDPYLDLLLVRGDDVTAFTTQGEPFFPNYTSLVGTLAVIVGSQGTFLRLSQSSPSGAGAYLWSLEAPCTPYPTAIDPTITDPPPSTPTAPAAQPVRNEARFTG